MDCDTGVGKQVSVVLTSAVEMVVFLRENFLYVFGGV
jgi:hypothetical protein